MEFPIGGTPSGISVDGRGDLWITDRTGGTVNRYGADGVLLQTISIGSEPGYLGDAFGLVPANVLHPLADFDVDEFPNSLEIDQFTNPFDEIDTPLLIPGFVEPVIDFSCFSAVQDVSLFWTNPDPSSFTAIEIRRDGVVAAVLPAESESFGEPSSLSVGTYAYEVVGIEGEEESVAETCTVVIGAGSLEGTTQIQVPGLAVNLFGIAAVPDPEAGAVAYYVTDPGNDGIYALDVNFEVLEVILSPLAGIAPTTGIVFDPNGNGGLGSLVICAGATGDPEQNATILELALDGTQIGDSFELVRPGSGFQGDLQIKGGLGGISKSQDSDIFMAVSPENCELFSFRTQPTEPGFLGITQIEILPLASALHPDPGYGLNGVYFPPLTSFGDAGGEALVSTIGANGEFAVTRLQFTGGIASTVGEAIPLAAPDDENVFGDFVVEGDRVAAVGITTGSVYQLGSAFFVRGDADAGGMIDVGDAIRILLICFGEIPAGTCVDAYDVDDNGMMDIGDAIGLLMYLFNSGDAPSDPFPLEGPDPTADGLPCL